MSEPKPKATPEEELEILRQLTESTGVLHEAQVLQLKYWPWILFTHISNSVAEVDLERRCVGFRLTIGDEEPPQDLNKRYRVMDEWVKTLLGDRWYIRIWTMKLPTRGFVLRFESKPKKPQKKDRDARRRV